jgi:hypothetical protein
MNGAIAPLSTQMQQEKQKYKKDANNVGAWPDFRKFWKPDTSILGEDAAPKLGAALLVASTQSDFCANYWCMHRLESHARLSARLRLSGPGSCDPARPHGRHGGGR